MQKNVRRTICVASTRTSSAAVRIIASTSCVHSIDFVSNPDFMLRVQVKTLGAEGSETERCQARRPKEQKSTALIRRRRQRVLRTTAKDDPAPPLLTLWTHNRTLERLYGKHVKLVPSSVRFSQVYY